MITFLIKFGGVIIGLIVVALVAVSVQSCNPNLTPKALASSTQNIVQDSKVTSQDVFAEIQNNLDMVTTLKAKIQDAQSKGETIPLDSVISDLTKVTESYEKLANNRDSIKQDLLSKINQVDDMRSRIDSEIHTLQLRKAGYQEQLRLVNDSDPDIVRTRKLALSQASDYVDRQIQLWQAFSNTQGEITAQMSDVQSRIDSFLSMIQSSAILFREGLNLLVLQRDLNQAINLFSNDLPKLESLRTSMERSWNDLDFLVNSLTGVSKLGIK